MTEQELAKVVVPPLQVQSVSTAQDESHPSPLIALPSSQYVAGGPDPYTLPSPQMSVHTLAVEESPRVQVQFTSTLQVASQPSPGAIFPSSQYPAVGFITIPSPQITAQILAVVASPNVHDHPVSTEQVESHPSPAVVPPSSQYPAVGSVTFPSPQVSVQTLAVDESPGVQFQSDSILQVASQPSPATVFPSSHIPADGKIINPSPQISFQVLAVDESPRVHSHPVSTAQLASHPSFELVPPSSQYPAVGLITPPSPQISVQTEAVEESPKVHDQPVSTVQLASHPSPAVVPLSSQ